VRTQGESERLAARWGRRIGGRVPRVRQYTAAEPTTAGHAMPSGLSEWAQLGEVLSGFGTWAGVGVAVFGLWAWGVQRRAEHAGDAAHALLVAIHRLCREVRMYSKNARALLLLGLANGQAVDKALRVLVHDWAAPMRAALEEVGEAALLATPILDDPGRWVTRARLLLVSLDARVDPLVQVDGVRDRDAAYVAARQVEKDEHAFDEMEQEAAKELAPLVHLRGGLFARGWARCRAIAAENRADADRDFRL
jgi:hypothetical protein